MPGTEVAVARIEEQVRGLVEDQKGFIEQRTARDQHIDLKFSGLQKQMQELQARWVTHTYQKPLRGS